MLQTPPSGFMPSINPCARLKVNLKGFVTKYWSIENNGTEQFRVNTSPNRVELRHSSGMFATAFSYLAEPDIKHPSLPLPNLNNSLLRSFSQIVGIRSREDSFLKGPETPKIKIEIERAIDIDRSYINYVILSAIQQPDHGFSIRDVPGHYKWRAWQIYDCRVPSKPLFQFIWFGNGYGKSTVGGIEVFAQLPDEILTALLIVVMAYFNECQKAEPIKMNLVTRNLFPRGPTYIAPVQSLETKQQPYHFLFNCP